MVGSQEDIESSNGYPGGSGPLKKYTPFGRMIWNHALNAGIESQGELANAIRKAGYRGRQGKFAQNTLSHMLRNPSPDLPPAFWRAIRKVLRLSDEEYVQLFMLYTAMGSSSSFDAESMDSREGSISE